MKFVTPFSSLLKKDADIAGGKGASLGEMLNAGIPVPDGFVVLSTTFDDFIEQADLSADIEAILESVDHKAIHTVDGASEKIQLLIKETAMPKLIAAEILSSFKELGSPFVAVRSSATAEDGADHAWAGQLDSYLNTTEETLLQKVQECWASLFTPRAIFYRFEKGLAETHISVAVVVQEMVNSEVSGIAFSVHPVTEDPNQLIIEAGFGLGEAIVSGSVTPDSYVVEKEPRNILDINVSTQERKLIRKEEGGNEWVTIPEPEASSQVLTEKQITELAQIIIGIENHYGFPCDIEWAFEDGKFYIVQSRPITTLMPLQEEVNVEGIVPSEYKFYGLWKGYLFANWFWTNWLTPSYLERINLDLKDGGVFVIKGGNFFLKKSTVQTIKEYIVTLIERKDMARFNEMRKISDEIFFQSIADIKSIDPNIVTPEIISQVSEIGRKIMFPWTFGYQVQKVFDELLTVAAQDLGIPLEKISLLMPEYDTPLLESQKKLREAKTMLKDLGYWDKLLEDPELAISEIKADTVVSEKLNNFSENYSWVGIMNLVGDRLSIEQVLEQITHLIDKKHEEKESLDIDNNMKFLVDAAATAGYMPQLEVEYYAMYSQYAMVFYKNAATQLGITYREFLDLNLDEIIAGLKGADVKNIIARRQDDNWAIFTVPGEEPKVIDNKKLVDLLVDKMVPRVEVSEDGSIVGQVGNKGVAQGRVKVILTPEEFSKMESGDVLVTTMTTPDYVPLMNKAGAIVTDIGGLLCHAAIISRELNKPCIIDTKFASQILKDGDLVEVDADNGVVRIIVDKISKNDKAIFEKIYTRDTTIIMQEEWGFGCTEGVKQAFGFENPNRPAIIHYMNDGSIEIWENTQATKYLMNKILEKNLADENFLPSVITSYNKQREEIKKYWDKKYLSDINDFPEYISKVRSVMNNFIFYYYSAVDDRTPSNLRKIALALRNEDILFASSDTFIRDTLTHHYPKLEGYETVILKNEVTSPLSLSELQKRRLHMTLIDGIDWKVETLGDLSLRQENLEFIELKESVGRDIKQVKGQVAFKGKVQGIVRLLRRRDQVKSVTDGEIIVSPMTTPDFMPAMEKAAAFVTDEGGITCHAAIVARELKKPCIIGTKVATQVFKDGDLVEVDADNGIVFLMPNEGEKVQNSIDKASLIFKGIETSRQEGSYSLLVYGSLLPGCLPPYSTKYYSNAQLSAALLFVNDEHSVTIFSWGDYVSFTKEAYQKYSTSNKDFKNVADFEKTWKKIDNWYKKYPVATLKKFSTEDLVDRLNKIFREYHQFLAETIFCESLSEPEIKIFYEQASGDADDFKKFLEISSKPVFDSFVLRQDTILLSTTDVNSIQRIFTNYFLAPDLEEIEKKRSEYINQKGGEEKINEEIRTIKKEIAIHSKEVKKYRATLSEPLKSLFDFVQLCMYLRDVRKEPLQQIITLMSNFTKEIFTKLGYDPQDAVYGYCDDFLKHTYKLPNYKEEIALRKTGVLVYFSQKEISFEYGEHKEKLDKALKQFDKVTSQDTLQGSVAYKGLVTGKVKIMRNEKDFSRFEQGDILVTSMTRPEFVPLMKIAAAVVTDEGGVTCHAAIISRELKLPCIIGTKHASRLFKDGDMVEVDANQGIVRKI